VESLHNKRKKEEKKGKKTSEKMTQKNGRRPEVCELLVVGNINIVVGKVGNKVW
jgi:hypothetical protein